MTEEGTKLRFEKFNNENLEHYFGKFENFPFSPSSYEYLAKSNKDIIGHYAALPYQYKFWVKYYSWK